MQSLTVYLKNIRLIVTLYNTAIRTYMRDVKVWSLYGPILNFPLPILWVLSNPYWGLPAILSSEAGQTLILWLQACVIGVGEGAVWARDGSPRCWMRKDTQNSINSKIDASLPNIKSIISCQTEVLMEIRYSESSCILKATFLGQQLILYHYPVAYGKQALLMIKLFKVIWPQKRMSMRNVRMGTLKGKFSSGIEGALASTLNHDFNWKQLSEMIFWIFLLMF